MRPAATKVLEQIASWPEADQEELAELAREIASRRSGVYAVSEDARKAIEEALDELGQRGTSESDMAAFWRACWRGMRVYFSPRATRDLTSIFLYLDARSKSGARNVVYAMT